MHIFVGGTGRSGTSILGQVLGIFPEVLLFMEPRFICDPGGIYDYVSGSSSAKDLFRCLLVDFRDRCLIKNRGVRPAMDDDDFWPTFYSFEFIKEAVIEHLAEKDRFSGARALIDHLFCSGMRAAGRKYWVEKTPHTVMRCNLLWRIFPDMRYIHVFRDPRDIYCSVRNFTWGPTTSKEFVVWYQSIMKDALKSRNSIPSECYIAIDLSDVADDPIAATERMLQFCRLPHDRATTALCAGKIDVEKCHLGRWRTELNKDDAFLITAECLPIYAQWRDIRAKLL